MELWRTWQLMDAVFFALQLFITMIAETASSAPAALMVTPPALIVPNNTKIVLTCQVHADVHNALSVRRVRWYMNRLQLISRSFYHDPDNNIHKIEFNATAGLDVNYTNISCLIENDSGRNWSNNVSLAILPDTEFSEPENPWLIEHQTYFQLSWSPIYLWRGHYIDYFIITVIDLNDGSIVSERVNVSKNLSDRYIESHNHTINRTCSEMLFVISAFSHYDGMLNGSFHARGKSQSDPNGFTEFVPPVSTTVLFDSLHFMIQVELPPVCNFEKVVIEYTIITNDNNRRPMYMETFSHVGWGVANHKIDRANLTVNQDYILRVVVNAKGLKIKTLQNFDTYLTCGTARRNQIRYLLLITMFLISLILVHIML